MIDMKSRSPLRELYDSVTQANGWSMRDVASRAAARNAELSKSRIGQLINADPLESISAYSIHALAAGLGVAPARVALAAVQSMGFSVAADDITPAEAIMRDETLSADTKDALLSILRAAQGRRRGA